MSTHVDLRGTNKKGRLALVGLLAAGWCLAGGNGDSEGMLRHFYYVNDHDSLASLERNYSHIGVVSPVWFAVNAQGKIESTLDPTLVEWARSRQVPLMPVLVNKNFDSSTCHLAVTDARVRGELVATVLRMALLHHLAGVQLDFENIAAGDRNAFTRFATELAQGLHNLGAKFSVAVMSPLNPAPRGNGAASTWELGGNAAPYDYYQLGAVADYVSLMTYDQHTSPDQPGPVAGLPWVEACVQKVLEVVPSSKLLLGIPLYYRGWSGQQVKEGAFAEARALADQQGAKVLIDPEQGESMIRYERNNTTHVVWFQDARTLGKRLELIRRYHLRGFSAWRLGQEDPVAWKGAFSTLAQKN